MRDVAAKIMARKGVIQQDIAAHDLGRKKGLTTLGVVKYLFLPDIKSRVRMLSLKLGTFAHFFALIFYSCRLIPAGHPVLQPGNIGYFGFSDVIATAASNLKMNRQNIDQIVMFGAVILSLVLFIANGAAIAVYTAFDIGDANAQVTVTPAGSSPPGAAANQASESDFAARCRTGDASRRATGSGSMFTAPNPECDLAYTFLDRVFGSTEVDMFHFGPQRQDLASVGIKSAVYSMLGMYSTAMMVIAVVIILYFAFTVVGESAMTGQPFGKRFNSFWAPIRLVIGLGLLVPIGGGLNAAQYATLYAAKMGSGFASFAWTEFVQTFAETDLIGGSTYPSHQSLVAAIARSNACMAIANRVVLSGGSQKVQFFWTNYPYGTSDRDRDGILYAWAKADMMATQTTYTGHVKAPIAETTYSETEMARNGEGLTSIEPNQTCGSIFVRTRANAALQNTPTTQSVTSQPVRSLNNSPNSVLAAVDTSSLVPLYNEMLTQINTTVKGPIDAMVAAAVRIDSGDPTFIGAPQVAAVRTAIRTAETQARDKTKTIIDGFREDYKERFSDEIDRRVSRFDKKGWMGAGLFYTDIADLNGIMYSILDSTYPMPTQDVPYIPTEEEMRRDDYEAPRGVLTSGSEETMQRMAWIMSIMQQVNQGSLAGSSMTAGFRGTFWENYLLDLFGAEAIKQFRNSPGTNPLADLVALGHGLYTKGMSYIDFIVASLLGHAALGWIPVIGGVTGFASQIATFMIFAATVGIGVGVFLYYVVPLLPFIFFFFSITAWVLEVVEAMVGLPLWALAHIRIDGDGLPGPAAQTGYTIIFGIMVRPFVILFAYVMGIVMFSAGMMMLKDMYTIYIGTLGDGEDRAIDYVAYSGIYAVLGLTMGMISFKQCDQMTNQIMRWFGGSDPRYGDGHGDPSGEIKSAAMGAGYVATQAGNNIGSMGQGMANSTSQSVGGLIGRGK